METPTIDTDLLQFLVMSGIDHDVTYLRFRDQQREEVRQAVEAQYRERWAQISRGMKNIETRISQWSHNMYRNFGTRSIGELKYHVEQGKEEYRSHDFGVKSRMHLNQVLEHYQFPAIWWWPSMTLHWMRQAQGNLDPYVPLRLPFQR